MSTITEKGKIVGIHTVRMYDMRSSESQMIQWAMECVAGLRPFVPSNATVLQKLHRGAYTSLMGRMQKFKKREFVVENLITTAGRSVLAQRLANTTTYTGIINYGVLGSSSTAVANSDTQLGTEVFRKVVASSSYTTNVAFIDFFYSKADTNGTYQEFGTVIDGTGSANTGQLFTHALTGGWVKASSESMTVSCQYTIT